MIRKNAIKTIEEIFNTDSIGLRDSFTDEQEAAIRLALAFLKNPECACCGYCQKFSDGETESKGWCEQHDREASRSDSSCGYYEQGRELNE